MHAPTLPAPTRRIPVWPDLRSRWNGIELMDDPACSEVVLWRTLAQFERVNRLVSRYRTILSQWVLDDMDLDPEREYHFIDLGAGGCDIPAWLLGKARRRGLRLRVTAIDSDPRAVRYAQGRHGQVAGLDIVEAPAEDPLAPDSADYVFCNHVLHHVPHPAIPTLLRSMHACARRRWLVSDLRRSRASYLGYGLLGLFFRRSFTREDGLRSIRRGFTPEELVDHLNAADLSTTAQIHALIPGRLLVEGSPLG